MAKLPGILLIGLCLTLVSVTQAANKGNPPLPDWQVLEFEEKAFWATARSRLEILYAADDKQYWGLNVLSSVVDNSEKIVVRFDPATGQALARSRLSRGKDQRLKSYQYATDSILRERRNPGADIVYDVKCSRHLNTVISELGGRPIMWKTGHSNIKAKLRETGAQQREEHQCPQQVPGYPPGGGKRQHQAAADDDQRDRGELSGGAQGVGHGRGAFLTGGGVGQRHAVRAHLPIAMRPAYRSRLRFSVC